MKSFSIVNFQDQVKKEAHSFETPLKHGSRGEIFRRFAERRLYLHLSQFSLECLAILLLFLGGDKSDHKTIYITSAQYHRASDVNSPVDVNSPLFCFCQFYSTNTASLHKLAAGRKLAAIIIF